ncbi:MAG: alpha/beta hydrolase [Thermoplasmatota archaeon]
MRVWRALLVAVLIVVGAVLAVSWQAGQGLLHPARRVDSRTPTEVGLRWSWANFTTADAVPLVGWWMPAAKVAPTVIFLHGYGESKAQGLVLYPFLHNATFNVLAYDARADGQSGGPYTTAGLLETRDVAAALEWVSRRPEGDGRVALFGWSAGAATALRAAPDEPSVAAVVADSSFSRLQHIVDSSIGEFTHLPRWPFGPLAVGLAGMSVGLDLHADAPVESAAHIHVPVLLIQGLADTTVTPDQVDELAAADPAAQVMKVPGAAHVRSHVTEPAPYEANVTTFLHAALG